jgi:segregation and condensation protein A
VSAPFAVHLDVYEGPFDLLLNLIGKHKLDITEIALSQVTEEFLAYTKTIRDLEQTTQFLLVAATLLDLKAARLLPQAEVEDEEDLALLEARDLLFARLMQYRAFKAMAAVLETRWESQQRRYPRAVGLEPRYAALLPELIITLTPEGLAELAARALAPKPEPVLSIAHVHAPAVSVREQAAIIVDRLRRSGSTTFRALTGDAPDTLTTVARFLALLELFREGVIGFDQATPLGELHVRWTGGDVEEVEVSDEFDAAAEQPAGQPTEQPAEQPAEPGDPGAADAGGEPGA